jgi:ABC-type glycerol-3-phosphate transport system substrate-binding protein
MMKRRMVIGLLSAAMLFLSACAGGSGGGSTPSFSYSGTWTGTINDSLAGAGTITVTLVQAGSNIAGTWQALFPAVGGSNGGNIVGVIDNTQVLAQLNPSDPTTCPYDVVAVRSGNTLSGTYAAFDCTIAVTGALVVSR